MLFGWLFDTSSLTKSVFLEGPYERSEKGPTEDLTFWERSCLNKQQQVIPTNHSTHFHQFVVQDLFLRNIAILNPGLHFLSYFAFSLDQKRQNKFHPAVFTTFNPKKKECETNTGIPLWKPPEQQHQQRTTLRFGSRAREDGRQGKSFRRPTSEPGRSRGQRWGVVRRSVPMCPKTWGDRGSFGLYFFGGVQWERSVGYSKASNGTDARTKWGYFS